jgi:hypothetical protein
MVSDIRPKSDETDSDSDSDRGQAFTLEAVIGGMLVLTAVLFAVQSAVITPSSTGGIDTDTRDQLADESRDVMLVTAEDSPKNLSYWVRYWNNSSIERTFSGGVRAEIGYGNQPIPGAFGERLRDTLRDNGYHYNVVMVYREKSGGQEKMVMAYRGTPSSEAVTTEYPVTLYDSDTLTGEQSGNVTLAEAGGGKYYPVPDIAPNSPIYNVVEVRITVW